MIGRTLLHYTIEAELGSGAMGKVYLARDRKTERRVALKFLGPNSNDEDARARLLREARAAARLSHPGIVTLHAIEESAGELFLVQEYVPGETLATRLLRGPLGVAETLRLARELASALDHAHGNGVLHRDLKPANILIASGGGVKIVDFGIAHLEGGVAVTRLDSMTGTLPYMAPERLSGDPGDARSDLFALGAVLYEAASGRAAFPGRTEAEVLLQVLNSNPEPLDLPGQSGAGLAGLVSRLIAKDPNQRPADAAEVIAILESVETSTLPRPITTHVTTPPAAEKKRPLLLALGGAGLALLVVFGLLRGLGDRSVGPAEAGTPSIAVLYFENVGDPADAGRIGAITGNLLVTSLAQSGELDILSTQTILDALYRIGEKGERVDRQTAMKVARTLKAGRIITGSILQTDPNIVMTTEVTDVATGKVVHATRVEGKPGETVFDLVDGLSHDIMEKLGTEADVADRLQPVSERASADMEAVRHYVEGMESFAQGDFEAAQASLEGALQRDPRFAQALFYMTIIQWWKHSFGDPEAAMAALRAVTAVADRLSPLEREILAGISQLVAYDFKNAGTTFSDLAGKYPDEKMIVYGLVESAFHQQQFHATIEHARRALAIDPGFTLAAIHLVDALILTRRFAEAESTAVALLERSPRNGVMWGGLIESHIARGQGDAAIRAGRAAVAQGASGPHIAMGPILVLLSRDSLTNEVMDEFRPDLPPEMAGLARDIDLGFQYWKSQRAGQFRRSLRIANEAWENMEASPDEFNSPFPIASRGQAGLGSGDHELVISEARVMVERLARWDSSGPFPTKSVIPYLHYRTGNLAAARREIDALKAQPEAGNPVLNGPLDFVEGLVLGREGKTGEALVRIDRGIPPDVPFYRTSLRRWGRIQALADGERYEEAAAELDTLMGAPLMDPRDAVLLHFQRGQILEQLGRTREAADSYREFLRIWRNADAGIPQVTEARRALTRLGSPG